MKKKWQTYEEVARMILDSLANEFGLESVEGKQEVIGLRSDTQYEIDAKGLYEGAAAIMIIECRRHTTAKIDQEQLAALAYRIKDTGAKGGLIVSPLGLQKGAKKIAKAENIVSVELSEDATPESYLLKFLNKLFGKLSDGVTMSDSVTGKVNPASGDRTESE